MFWALIVQLFLLSGVIFSGLAVDVVRHAVDGASPTMAPRWPLGLAPPSEWTILQQIALAASLVLLFTILRAIAHYFGRVTDEALVQAIIVDLRVRLYDKLQHMSFGYFDHQDSGTLINRVTTDTQSVRMFIQGVLIRLAVTLAALFLFLGYMIHQHWRLTLAVMAVLPAQVIVMWVYARQIRPRFRALRLSMDRLVQALQEAITGVRVIKGFGQELQMIQRFDGHVDAARDRRMAIVRSMSAYVPAVPATAFLQLAILLAYGGYLLGIPLDQGGLGLGSLWVFLSLLRQLATQIDRIVQSASSIPEALTGAERVFELLDAPVGIASGVGAVRPAGVQGRIRFENVSFAYQDGPCVLQDISLEIAAGERVAIVGPAGSGKTTLLSLLPRFYDPTAGRIFVDDVDIREWDLEALRRNIGVVFQEPFLFSNTIAANVAFGRPEAGEALVRQAVDDAAATEFVLGSHHGLDTIIGERGLTLSGGERQRLSLARALLTSPPILLLDDATSAVDPRTEVKIQTALDRIMQGSTTLIIAHRLSTLRQADRIVVIERGRVTAVGTHEQLLESNAHYRESARIQLEREKVSSIRPQVEEVTRP